MSADQPLTGDEFRCPGCGGRIDDVVQHYVPEPCDPLVHGEQGRDVLGPVEVRPCGCHVAPGDVTEVSL